MQIMTPWSSPPDVLRKTTIRTSTLAFGLCDQSQPILDQNPTFSNSLFVILYRSLEKRIKNNVRLRCLFKQCRFLPHSIFSRSARPLKHHLLHLYLLCTKCPTFSVMNNTGIAPAGPGDPARLPAQLAGAMEAKELK
jgi:hypothetical protein